MNVTFIVPFSAPVSLAPERCHALSRIDVSPFPSKKETINLYDLRRLLRRLSITMTVLPASISLFVGASLFPRFSFFRFFLKHDNSDSLKREKKEVARRNLLASSWQESQEEGFIFDLFLHSSVVVCDIIFLFFSLLIPIYDVRALTVENLPSRPRRQLPRM